MAPPKFKDLGKKADDTIVDDEKCASKCEIKTKAKGLNLTSTFTGNTNDSESGKAFVRGTLEAKAKYMDSDVSVKLTDDGKATIKVENSTAVKNLKLTTEYTVGETPKLSGEYKHDMAFLTGAYDVGKNTLDVSASCASNGVSAGVSQKIPLGGGKKAGVPDFRVMYATKALELTAFCNSGGKDAGVKAMNQVSDKMAVAVTVAQAKTDKGADLSIAVGTAYALDSDTDLSATVSNKGNIHACCESKLNDTLKIKASGMINTRNAADFKAHKWGLHMLYSL
eukprot:CAMPEP_0196718596 /NCGR_PEP_ID=MMETSP1091-20130531/1762_1 /TAXON_ID=302021 /ORGANISM="Rhodomonas sp., Strain CCMP768" /LENGTH=280 /DNA_ID=CAMNT_0042059299 /DNA_START=25 /DNA_END=867 /DNA_ORIENTATION=-